MHKVFLYPGFLGYEHFGAYHYFDRSAVRALHRALGDRVASVTRLTTNQPTGSLADRQRDLIAQLADAAEDTDDIHLVGHSTGGLDAYLLLADLPRGLPAWDEESLAIRSRIRSITAISPPFWGSNLAERVARVLPELGPATRDEVGDALFFPLANMGLNLPWTHHDILDLLVNIVLSGKGPGFVLQALRDHRLVADLRPNRMIGVQQEIRRALDVPFAYFVTVASAPTPPLSIVEHPHFSVVYFVTAAAAGVSLPAGIDPTALAGVPWIANGSALPIADLGANDGIVNSLLQVLPDQPPTAFVRGDHADVLGHYRRGVLDQGELDSASGFDQRSLEDLWGGVARNILAGMG